MGDYITQTDLEDVFGETNVAAWSDMEGNREVDTNRVTKAIAWGESKVVATLRRSKYVVPLQAASGSTLDPIVTNWMAVYAGHWLYMHRQIRANEDNTRTEKLKEETDNEMKEIMTGMANVDLKRIDDRATTAPSLVIAPVPMPSRSRYT